MLLERKDVHIDTPDSANHTPLSLARAEGHDRIVNMLREQGSVNSHTADLPARHSSPPPIAIEASAADMPITGGDPNTDILDITFMANANYHPQTAMIRNRYPTSKTLSPCPPTATPP
ncbi:hypothetical protein HOY82DRAFT_606893 [Tuber indicum]|nr:hypothetical protein HOY82DRAFT_606893 [Tuber indicum]